MAGKGVASKTTAQPKGVARRLWRVMRAVLYMLRRVVLPSGRKVAMDLCLLLHHGKIAGKPSKVEFSCSHNASFSAKRRGQNLRQSEDEAANDYNAADIAKVFEMLNEGRNLFSDDDVLTMATPSPEPWSSAAFGRRPAARQPRITGSPCADEQQVDRKADEFIRRFYEQLRAQKSVTATPEYHGSYVEHGTRPVAAGIA
ncbi:unnamed protein product [Alopecurus aequalis]